MHRLYGVWQQKVYASHPLLLEKRAKVVQETKKCMRRLSADNTKVFARHFAAISHCNPTVVFHTILDQLQVLGL